jgi:diamine N-acetyltransferase
MIDAAHQGKGFGRKAIRLLLAEWRADPDVAVVKTSYEPTNHIAEHLYSSIGFVPEEIADWGERVATLKLSGESPRT